MRKRASIIVTGVVLLCSASCGGPEAEYRPTATVKDIMDSVVDPSADHLWDSVVTEQTPKGTIEKVPKTDDDWKELRRNAVALMEATNLLQIPDRLVARPGEKADNPQVEEPPEVIKTMIDSDRATWIRHTHVLHDAATAMLKAIEARDVAGVLKTGDQIDKACEECHTQYWYPEKPKQ